MYYKNLVKATFVLAVLFSGANAQRAEVTVGLDETFFNALIDSALTNFDAPEFPIAFNAQPRPHEASTYSFASFNGPNSRLRPACNQTIRILKETGGVRTSVR